MKASQSLTALQQNRKMKEKEDSEIDQRKEIQSQFTSCTSKRKIDCLYVGGEKKKRYGRSSRQTGPDSQEDSKKTYQEQQQPFWPPRDLISG